MSTNTNLNAEETATNNKEKNVLVVKKSGAGKDGFLTRKKIFNGVSEITGHTTTNKAAFGVILETLLAITSRMKILNVDGKLYTYFPEVLDNGSYKFKFLIPNGCTPIGLSAINYKSIKVSKELIVPEDTNAAKVDEKNKSVELTEIDLTSTPVIVGNSLNHTCHKNSDFRDNPDWDSWEFTYPEPTTSCGFFVFAVVWKDSKNKENLSYISYFIENNDSELDSITDPYVATRNYIANLAAGNVFGSSSYKRYKIDTRGKFLFEHVDTVNPVRVDIPKYSFSNQSPLYRYDSNSSENFQKYTDYLSLVPKTEVFDPELINDDLVALSYYLRRTVSSYSYPDGNSYADDFDPSEREGFLQDEFVNTLEESDGENEEDAV